MAYQGSNVITYTLRHVNDHRNVATPTASPSESWDKFHTLPHAQNHRHPEGCTITGVCTATDTWTHKDHVPQCPDWPSSH